MNSGNIVRCVEKIINGGVVIFPTETVYALSADARNTDAIEKIYSVKHRDLQKKLSIFVRDIQCIYDMCYVSDVASKIIEKYMPGELTVILNLREHHILSPRFFSDNVGIRIPKNDTALEILNNTLFPLVATSVNVSGQASIKKAQNLDIISELVDYVIRDDSQVIGQESAIIDVRNGDLNIVREGRISQEILLKGI